MSYQIIDGEYVKMRYESEMPQNPTEQSLENALVEFGCNREDIMFYGVENRKIRYGYWQPLHIPIETLGLDEEVYEEDDDIKPRYSYGL